MRPVRGPSREGSRAPARSSRSSRSSRPSRVARVARVARIALAALPPLVALTPGAAEAFCRSTTCTGDCPRDDDGCKTTGIPLAWASRCLGFSIQRDLTVFLPPELTPSAIERAFAAWTELECESGKASLAFVRLGDVACRRAEHRIGGPNANVVVFQDNAWSYKGLDNNLAKTTVHFDAETGEILGADIEVNTAFNEFTVDREKVVKDLQAVLTHEVGHFIGLDHTGDFSATMFAGYSDGDTHQRVLQTDDVAGACAIYPPDSSAACQATPEGGLADACGSAAAPADEADPGCAFSPPGAEPRPLFLVALLALGGLARRRSRRGPGA